MKRKYFLLSCFLLYALSICVAVLAVAILKWEYIKPNHVPHFSNIPSIKERKQAFIAYLSPYVMAETKRFLKEREELEKLYAKYIEGEDLTYNEARWLRMKAVQMRVSVGEKINMFSFYDLRRRMDVVPPSMVIAQAAIETGWGTSRFFKEGLSLFGQQCYNQGCGIVPRNRNEGSLMEVQKFDTPLDAFRAYLENINTHRIYAHLRYMRMHMRVAGKELQGKKLANGLTNYSEIGEKYNGRVKDIIAQNDLDKYDEMVENINHIIMEKGYY